MVPRLGFVVESQHKLTLIIENENETLPSPAGCPVRDMLVILTMFRKIQKGQTISGPQNSIQTQVPRGQYGAFAIPLRYR
jgi:hypothetical protein